MPNAYTWQFKQLDVCPSYQTLTDAVINMHWTLIADDGSGHTAKAYGSEPCGPVDPADFVPFAELTLEEVQGWLVAQLTTDEVDAIKAQLDRQISDQIAPQIVPMRPPWET